MSVRDTRRDTAISAMAAHMLRNGLPNASLRTLAAAAGTSDRMLLYYFADKDELLAATFAKLAGEMSAMLDAALPEGMRLPYDALLSAVWVGVRSDAMRPYMLLFIELAAAAARGIEPHARIAPAILDGFLAWADGHLDIADAGERAVAAARLLATVDGAMLIDAAGRGDVAMRAMGGVAG